MGRADHVADQQRRVRAAVGHARGPMCSGPRRITFTTVTLLISSSFDGELIARTIERMGFLTVRGSSSRRGIAGLRAMALSLANQSAVVFPADGPRGPRYSLKPGAVKLAQMTGDSIRPFYLRPRSAWQLRSWDGFLIPKPWTQVAVCWGTAITVPADADEESFERKRQEVEMALEDVRRRAEEHVGLNH